MSEITTNEAKVGASDGATWGTAVAATDLLEHTSVNVNQGSQIIVSNNNVQSNFEADAARGIENVDVTVNGECGFGGGWHYLMYRLLGTTTASPAEVNTGEGDYLHNIDFANAHSLFSTLAFHVEDDVVGELPSVKFSTALIEGDVENGKITYQLGGMADRFRTAGATNTPAGLTALTANQTEQILTMQHAENYVRMNAKGGATLSSSDDLCISSFRLQLTRPIGRRFCMRGANTRFTEEPRLTGKTTGSLTLTLTKIDDGEADFQALKEGETLQKIEMNFQGDPINSGADAYDRFQFPIAYPESVTGYQIDGPSVFQQPSIVFRLLGDTTAPSGMSGVTDVMRLATVNERSSAF